MISEMVEEVGRGGDGLVEDDRVVLVEEEEEENEKKRGRDVVWVGRVGLSCRSQHVRCVCSLSSSSILVYVLVMLSFFIERRKRKGRGRKTLGDKEAISIFVWSCLVLFAQFLTEGEKEGEDFLKGKEEEGGSGRAIVKKNRSSV